MKRLFTKRMAATVTMLFIILFAVSSSQEARAQNPAETPQNEQAPENPDTGWRNQLNLTPDQVSAIRVYMERFDTGPQGYPTGMVDEDAYVNRVERLGG